MAYWSETDTTVVCQSLTIGTSNQITNVSEPLVAPGSSNEIPSSKAVVDYVAAIAPPIVMTTKGDLVTRTAVAIARQPVGLDNQVLTADSLQATGIKWATPANVCDVATLAGDLIVATGAHTYGRLAASATAGQALTSNGAGVAPSYTDGLNLMVGHGALLCRNGVGNLTNLPSSMVDGQMLTVDTTVGPGLKYIDAPTVYLDGSLVTKTGGSYSQITIGAANQSLVSNGSQPGWSSNNAAAVMSGVSDLLTTSVAHTLSRIPIGAANTVLSSNGATASWQSLPASIPDTLTTDGDLLSRYAGAYARLAIATGLPGYQLTINPGGTLPVWRPSASVLTNIGDLVSLSSTGPPEVYTRIAASTAGRVLTANGANVLPSWQDLPANKLDQATNVGDLIYCATVGPVTYTRLAASTAGYLLTSGGANTAPSWAAAPAASIPNVRMLQGEDWDVPSNADWPITSIAGVEPDPTNAALNVRRFAYNAGAYGTGAGFKITVPSSAANIVLKFWGRSTNAAGAAKNVSFRFYIRRIPDDAVVLPAWAYNSLADISVSNSAYFQAASQTRTLAQIGVTAGQAYHVELSRQAAGADNLAYDYLLAMLTLTWT